MERGHDPRFFYHMMKRENMERQLKRTGAKQEKEMQEEGEIRGASKRPSVKKGYRRR